MLSDSDFEDPDKISKLNSNNNKRGSRRLLVRQQATAGTEHDQEAEITLTDHDLALLETVSGDQVRDIMDTPDPVTPTQAEAGRVIYSETIDISPGSPVSGRSTRTMFESQLHQAARHSFVYGSARYLPKVGKDLSEFSIRILNVKCKLKVSLLFDKSLYSVFFVFTAILSKQQHHQVTHYVDKYIR